MVVLSDDLVHVVKAQISDDVPVTLPEFAVLNWCRKLMNNDEQTSRKVCDAAHPPHHAATPPSGWRLQSTDNLKNTNVVKPVGVAVAHSHALAQ